MRRLLFVLLIAWNYGSGQLIRRTPADHYASAEPKLPFLDWGICPGEGCRYGRWTARKPAVIFDTWKEPRKRVAQLVGGEPIVGLTGLVVTLQPGAIQLDHDIPVDDLHGGDVLQTYTYQGEGNSVVWAKGQMYPTFDISLVAYEHGGGCVGSGCQPAIREPTSAWWALVKLSSGKTGWNFMNDAEIDGVCDFR